jgi:hypothetical protein
VNERLRYFEKRFQQISSATGLTNPDAIITKFSLKEEIKAELNVEIGQKNLALQELTAQLHHEQAALHTAKQNFSFVQWKDVDVLYKVVHDSQANASHHQAECDRMDERLAFYKEGMLALLSMLPPELQGSVDPVTGAPNNNILSALEGSDLSHEQVLQLLAVLGDRLLGLSDAVTEGEMRRVQRQRDAEEHKRLQDAQNQARLAQEIAEKLKMSSMMRRAGNGAAAGGATGAAFGHGARGADQHDVDEGDDEDDVDQDEADGSEQDCERDEDHAATQQLQRAHY